MFGNMQLYHERMKEELGFGAPEANSLGALLSSHPVDSERLQRGVELLPEMLQGISVLDCLIFVLAKPCSSL